MAIENTLIHFNKQEDFEKKVDEIPKTGITFIKDAGIIYTHGEKYQSVRWASLPIPVEGFAMYKTEGEVYKDSDGNYFYVSE